MALAKVAWCTYVENPHITSDDRRAVDLNDPNSSGFEFVPVVWDDASIDWYFLSS